jgi:hypothetical protein
METNIPDINRWFGPQNWIRDGEGPCISLGPAGSFDETHVFCPCVIFEDGSYRMYYCGSRGVAVSGDGVQWSKYAGNPVFTPGPLRDWESNYTTSETILPMTDGGFRIWYASRMADFQMHKYFAIGTARLEGPED